MANIGSWYALNQEGFRIGDRGTEQGIIVRDEEYSVGARVTLERDCGRDGSIPFAISCGIYGFSAHTAHFNDARSANAAWAAFKQQLADIVDMMPYPDDPDAEAKLKPALAAWDAFVRRW